MRYVRRRTLLAIGILLVLAFSYLYTAAAEDPLPATPADQDYQMLARTMLAEKAGSLKEDFLLQQNNCPGNPCSVLFTREYQGLPVFRSLSGVWFKDGNAAEIRMSVPLPLSISTTPAFTPQEIEMIIKNTEPSLANSSPQKYSYVIYYAPYAHTVHLAAKVDYPLQQHTLLQKTESGDAQGDERYPYTHPSILVDAQSGEILEILEQFNYDSLSGRIRGEVFPGSPYAGSAELPFAHEPIIVNGETTVSNEEGLYAYRVLPGEVSIQSQLQNERLQISNEAQEEAYYAATISVSGEAIHDWNWNGYDASYSLHDEPVFSTMNPFWTPSHPLYLEGGFAEVHEESNVYYWINQIQDYFDRGVYPFTLVPDPFPMMARVQDSRMLCNAGAGETGLYFTGTPESGTCFASSLDPTVVLHEFTHRIVAVLYSALPYERMWGAMNEGFADYFAGSILNEHRHGFFYSGASGSSNRDLLNSRRYPDDYYTGTFDFGGVHLNANIFSGMLWDIRQALGQESADDLIVRAMELNGASPAEDITFFSFCSDVVRMDDMLYGNSNPFDGSPHLTQLCTACSNHGITASYCTLCPVGEPDDDGDGWGNSCDNCASIHNPGQEDGDGDGIGNSCDACSVLGLPFPAPDQDDDGVPDVCDSCPGRFNPDQADADNDGIGDACDFCPAIPEIFPADADADGIGDACDTCPWFSNPGQEDTDADGRGNSCDVCPTGNDGALPPLLAGSLDISEGATYAYISLAVDADNNLYLANPAFNTVQKLDSSGDVLWTREGFNQPLDIAFVGEFLYVAESGNGKIVKINLEGERMAEWSTGLFPPLGVAADHSLGRIYVLTRNNILVFDASGTRVATWADSIISSDGIHGITVDRMSNLYFTYPDAVFKLDSAGKLILQWGSSGEGPGEFTGPNAVAVDGEGYIYVGDGERVQKFSPAGNYLLEVEGLGFSRDLFVSEDKVLYVVDAPTTVKLFTLLSDVDTDFVDRRCDNCPFIPNRAQIDSDHDGMGDACQGTSLGACRDSDGTSYETVGAVTAGLVLLSPLEPPLMTIAEDYCAYSWRVVERLCNADGGISSTSYECRDLNRLGENYVCGSGACISIGNRLPCYESDRDAADEHTTAGYVDVYWDTPVSSEAVPVGDNFYRVYDSCSGDTLQEYDCSGDGIFYQAAHDLDCDRINPAYTCLESSTGAYCG